MPETTAHDTTLADAAAAAYRAALDAAYDAVRAALDAAYGARDAAYAAYAARS